MTRFLIFLLLSGLLLCGCTAQNPQSPTSPPAATGPSEAVPEPTIAISSRQEGALQTYLLAEPLNGIMAWGENLLLFSGAETTSLSLLHTPSMTVCAAYDPGFLLLPENVTVQRLDAGLSYFDSAAMETVVLNEALEPVRRIPAPDGLAGFPLLSNDGSRLYYCTADAIRALELESGISRILKEASYPTQGLSGLLLEDSILQVSITDTDGGWWTLFLSSETGQLIRQCSGNILPETGEDSFFLDTSPEGSSAICFGDVNGSIQTLSPLHADLGCFFLPDSGRALSVGLTGEETMLELYDLNTGLRQAALTLPGILCPQSVAETARGNVWFLCHEEAALFRWDPSDSAVADTASYVGSHYTREAPDYDGLAACTLYAQELSAKHGINILVYKDAVAVEPWDYRLDYEHQADVLRRELDALDARLSAFPAGFLDTLTEKFTGVNICLVRSAAGSPESGSLEAVSGIQFLVDFDAYIVLSTLHDTQYALYHELYHLMETVILTGSTAYDRWEKLNPVDFQYDNDMTANQPRDDSAWLEPGAEYFIDTYSMSSAREDRARIFEFAMTAGHEGLFSSPHLQRKLWKMCTGIREAFGLENHSNPLPWEQYLSY